MKKQQINNIFQSMTTRSAIENEIEAGKRDEEGEKFLEADIRCLRDQTKSHKKQRNKELKNT